MFVGGNNNANWIDSTSDLESGTVAENVSICLNQGLLMIIFYVLVFYEAVAIGWVFILNAEAGDSIIKMNSALDIVGSIFVFVYFYIWLTDYITGFSDGPRRLRTLLTKITELGLLTSSFMTHIRIVNREHCDELKKFCVTMLISTYDPFRPNSNFDLRRVSSRTISQYYSQIKSVTPNGDQLVITSTILRQFRVWAHGTADFLKDHRITVVDSMIKDLLDSVIETDAAVNVRSTMIFKRHLVSSLYIYFFVWIPISIGTRVDNAFFLVIYPFTMFILTGPFVYRKWLGDPFQNNPPIMYNNYDKWISEDISKIEQACSFQK